MTVEVRNATDEDVDDVTRIYHAAYGENERMGFPSSVLERDAGDVAGWLHDRTVLVATRGNETVGVVQLIPRSECHHVEIGRLAVSPAHQGEGIGRLLLEAAEECARAAGHDGVRLRTLSDHPFLEEWYRREGYVRVGVERLDDHPYDAPILEKDF